MLFGTGAYHVRKKGTFCEVHTKVLRRWYEQRAHRSHCHAEEPSLTVIPNEV